MNLSDLLVSYNQVKAPENVETTPEVKSDRYTRLLDFINNKNTNSVASEASGDSDTESTGWKGWTYSGTSTSNTPTQVKTYSPNTSTEVSPKVTREWLSTPKTNPTNTVRAIQTGNKSAYDKFIRDFDAYLERNPHNKDTKDVLTAIAALESGYNPGVSNKHSGALGYFLFLDSTRADYNKSSREEFANNADLQFDAAVLHYRMLQRQLSKYEELIKNSGLSDLQVAYGMWWRPGSMLARLRTGKDDYVNKSDGMTLEKILQRAV